jgi:hypothetical protein
MIKVSSVMPYFIMIACPLVIYYFLLQEQSSPSIKITTQTTSQSILNQAIKNKQKVRTKMAHTRKQGDFSEQFFQELNARMPADHHDLLQQLLALEPFHQSAILSLKDKTLSWLSNLTVDQRSDVLHILQQRPSGQWQENLESLQQLPEDELRTVLSQQRLARNIPKESLDQRPFDRL